ncbi:pyruvate dehydrogenase complex E3, dihydrolipoamide dehydrogenase [Methanocella conradii HZ254]|uniref:Dihydrolipoyl dehydrogenase n=1 Tax=Methanocella conradii (strain DSM 24694 / JCM 17849 / CGMCC 1.5162 / HZ254) TaxID=1041930 RepID=H8I4N8_METCZ|nr:dihydrolipoyl dehydrogenase [Methanocella conradii]AFD00633.1 pyruvate dehydrogenase complex E3, dihydrolipoamide dehydrogenase [Methanocella conradii HZ254]
MVVGDIEVGTDVLIAGAGPAGYTAAIRCARLGLDVTLIDRNELGGVCLHKGCIPVKALLHVFRLVEDCRRAADMGVKADGVAVDLKKAYEWKDAVVKRLEHGIRELCQASGVQVMEGSCSFLSSSKAVVSGPSGTQRVTFRRAVIATGARHKPLPGLPFDGKSVLSPDDAIYLDRLPDDVVILGGGYAAITIGALMAAGGMKPTIIHKGERMLSFVDRDLIRPVIKKFGEKGVKVFQASSWSVERMDDGLRVEFEHDGVKEQAETKTLVVAIGMLANTDGMGLENTGVRLDGDGFVMADENFRTDDPAFYAIGDVKCGHCNASIAFWEGMSLAGILAGRPGWPGYMAVPQTISTDPEIASAGYTEEKAKEAGIEAIVGRFPFTANGKAVSMGKAEGFVKVIAEKGTHRILGVHVVGPGAFDILQEGVLAIEMGARLEDIMLTLHPHPTLCEAVKEACAAALRESTSIIEKS